MQQSMSLAEDSKAQQGRRGSAVDGRAGQGKVYVLETRCRLSALALAIFSLKETLDRVNNDADSCKRVMYNLIHEDT